MKPDSVSIQCFNLRLVYSVQFFSNSDRDSSCHNKKVVQDSMEVFTLCNCDNITNSYAIHCQQKQIAVAIRKNVQCERALNLGRQMGGIKNYVQSQRWELFDVISGLRNINVNNS